MAILLRNRSGLLIRGAALILALWAVPAGAAEKFLDAALADVNGTLLAASDVAIARAPG